MGDNLPRGLQWEDVLLLVWLGLIEPLLYRLFGAVLGNVTPPELGSTHNFGIALLFLLAALGGVIVVATRAPGEIGPFQNLGSVAGYAYLPMLVTLGYFFIYGLGPFGENLPQAALCLLFAFYVVLGLLFNRLPLLPILYRRLLISPMIVLSTWNFSALIRIILNGFDLPSLLNQLTAASPAERSLLASELGLLFVFVGFFYLVFIVAPRQIAYPTGSWRDWLVRFGIYMLGVLLNIGWLRT